MTAALGRCLATAFLARLADEGMGVAVVLAALARTGDAAQGAFVLTAWLLPHVVTAPLTGALVGRVRRPASLCGAALGCFALAIAALAALVGRAPTPPVLAVALAGGACGPVVSGGLSSLVAELTPEGRARDRAYAWDSAGYNAASLAGPALVALLAGAVSPGAALAALALSAGLAAPLAATLPLGRRAPARTTRLRADLLVGARVVWAVRPLRAVTSATVLSSFGLGALTTASVLLAEGFGAPGQAGALLTAFALGALLGALAVPGTVEPGRLAGWSLLGLGLALSAAAWAPGLACALPLYALAGCCDGPLLTATLRLRAAHAPAHARAQVFTLGAGLKLTAASLGAAAVGLAAALPPPALLLTVALCQLAAAALHRALAGRPAPTAPTGRHPGERAA
ncbi:Major Facilitator Superfamily protein [Streptomyces zhaozhouensis]|uniref:Major Facilitator Superfamily protein n=1 Tax=Streptomyces zhaozhouensis TaxID=1300267 RepID=A0A286DK70_9ACTN|nr:MFS transporter [Streptomyces zhaozhouensis]SOD59011.1 Major Facilitator Superfamily protein [Streptomyces zhaozhouensis]